jgi:hypothetical protein
VVEADCVSSGHGEIGEGRSNGDQCGHNVEQALGLNDGSASTAQRGR